MDEPSPTPPSQALVQSLLRKAGVDSARGPLTLLGVSACSVWRVTAGGQPYIVRYRLDGEPQFAQKEVYVSDLLQRHGISAPRVLAINTGTDGVATLSTCFLGIPLSQALEYCSPADLHSAWRAIGATMRRVHAIVLPVAAEIVADGVIPFVGRWAGWVLADLSDDIRWLQAALSVRSLDRSRLDHLVAAATVALTGAPVRLIHNDALPQNILVAPKPHGWVCTGWLDWEFARACDPYWDISTPDFRPAGLVPPALYEGYGEQPAERLASIYDLLTATWRTRVELEQGTLWTWPPQQARIEYLRSLPAHLDRLAALLHVDS